MASVFAARELPRFTSLRDTRDRLDLVTENVPVGATALKADRIVYHPGDTAAAHYHVGCLHVFYVLRGRGIAYVEGERTRLEAGSVHVVEPGRTHWFENDGEDVFSFVELWSPPPEETVWTESGDVCTWRPEAAPDLAEVAE
ncbi:MAG TPA: cupin domain-containing protein [Gaiellaceae bacterium]|jgi:quercetin dioxygenase-like cupin family protein